MRYCCWLGDVMPVLTCSSADPQARNVLFTQHTVHHNEEP